MSETLVRLFQFQILKLVNVSRSNQETIVAADFGASSVNPGEITAFSDQIQLFRSPLFNGSYEFSSPDNWADPGRQTYPGSLLLGPPASGAIFDTGFSITANGDALSTGGSPPTLTVSVFQNLFQVNNGEIFTQRILLASQSVTIVESVTAPWSFTIGLGPSNKVPIQLSVGVLLQGGGGLG